MDLVVAFTCKEMGLEEMRPSESTLPLFAREVARGKEESEVWTRENGVAEPIPSLRQLQNFNAIFKNSSYIFCHYSSIVTNKLIRAE